MGYRIYYCSTCRGQLNKRTGTPFKDLQFPTDVVLLAVAWRLRYTLGFQDISELLLQRGFEVGHESVRAWEYRFQLLVSERLR
jgi:transposase-like protein